MENGLSEEDKSKKHQYAHNLHNKLSEEKNSNWSEYAHEKYRNL